MKISSLKRLQSALLIAALASFARFSSADNIELPARAIAADTQIVIRGDLTAVTADTLEKTKTIIISMLGDAAKNSGPSKDEWQQILDSRDALAKAGVQQLVVVIGSFPQGPDALKPSLLLKLKAGTDPAAVEKAMKDVDAANAKRTGNPATMDKTSIKALDNDWAYVDGDQFGAIPAAGDAKLLTAFQTSLGAQDGAPIRMALQLNDATKAMIAATAANPNLPPFAKNLMDGLPTLQTANLGVTTGDVLKIRTNANFSSADAAAAFKKSLDAALVVLPAITPPEVQPQIAVAVTLFTMKVDGAALTNTTDSDQLKAAIKAATPKDAAPAPGGPAPAPQN